MKRMCTVLLATQEAKFHTKCSTCKLLPQEKKSDILAKFESSSGFTVTPTGEIS